MWWATEIPGKDEEPKDVSTQFPDVIEATDQWQFYRDGKRVLECLQRSLRVADACMDTAVSVELFVEILNRYVYYFDQENDAVSFDFVMHLNSRSQSQGHHKVSQRADRAHTFQPSDQRKCGRPRSS